MRKWLVVVAVLALGGLALADTAVGTGDPASASLDVTVTWSALNWIILYIPTADMSVDLGTIKPDLYDPENEKWKPLESGGHTVIVVTNDPGGFVLTIEGALVAYPSGHPNPSGILSRLGWASATVDTKGTLDEVVTYIGSRGLTSATDVTYSFTPSFDDVPGTYQVTVTYTATTQ